MDRRTFAILCHLLRNVNGLSSTEIVDVEDMVVMFLHVFAHDELIKRPIPVTNNCNDQRWKCFENCLGALDGTYIKVNVPARDHPTFETRKGEIVTNVLGVCETKGDFVYVLAGWDGSAADSRIICDALLRENGLQVPKGYICVMWVIQTWKDFSPHTEASGTICKSGVVLEMRQQIQMSTST
ncbi:retrotransposon protein [Cucumis melo var. makuwa]|uniref:Retrotransposon protein n=1 Tax=Cucumis melo var. makuwa TaxID=1194695 RepID=A0A5A7UMV2_CUCMM|nr:retrotransposon protein [Cucumis melo var. makuwa]